MSLPKAEQKVRAKIKINGIVQGVGFRPFIYRLAKEYQLLGWVLNSVKGVEIEVEGKQKLIEDFYLAIEEQAPPLARIKEKALNFTSELLDYDDFLIKRSNSNGEERVLITPDVAICDDCRAEMKDRGDRRYNYPFINCTNCGPRFTIIEGTPYDRPLTTMKEFNMCSNCQDEYNTPLDRRFHAQPNACEECGPSIRLLNSKGDIIEGAPIKKTTELLLNGKIVAIKGLGGYHLACDATKPKAVRRLRKIKNRPSKPLAVMAKNLEVIEKICDLDKIEVEELTSPAAPIVLLETKQITDVNFKVANEINPDTDKLGMMLPYTPIHELLLTDELPLIVLTSANLSGQPLMTSSKEVYNKLDVKIDAILANDRQIANRVDDSVVYKLGDEMVPIRRSRGYVPFPIRMGMEAEKNILACGAQQKNTFALVREQNIFLSQHIGNLNNLATYNFYQESINKLQHLLQVNTEVVVTDLHPDYLSTGDGKILDSIELVEVQHHQAHIASCMVEHQLDEEVIGVAFDGTGYGLDEEVWGGEFFVGGLDSLERVGHLEYVPLPGGEVSVKNPYRMAFSYLYHHFEDIGIELAKKFLPDLEQTERQIIKAQIEEKINTPLTSSMGRLFAAVSALLGICTVTDYTGQAAIKLESIIKPQVNECYSFKITEQGIIKTDSLWAEMIVDLESGIAKEKIATKFHNTVVEFTLDLVGRLSKEYNFNKIVFSGGVMQNRYLVKKLKEEARDGLDLYFHEQVPPNDGGLALGQAVIGSKKLND